MALAGLPAFAVTSAQGEGDTEYFHSHRPQLPIDPDAPPIGDDDEDLLAALEAEEARAAQLAEQGVMIDAYDPSDIGSDRPYNDSPTHHVYPHDSTHPDRSRPASPTAHDPTPSAVSRQLRVRVPLDPPGPPRPMGNLLLRAHGYRQPRPPPRPTSGSGALGIAVHDSRRRAAAKAEDQAYWAGRVRHLEAVLQREERALVAMAESNARLEERSVVRMRAAVERKQRQALRDAQSDEARERADAVKEALAAQRLRIRELRKDNYEAHAAVAADTRATSEAQRRFVVQQRRADWTRKQQQVDAVRSGERAAAMTRLSQRTAQEQQALQRYKGEMKDAEIKQQVSSQQCAQNIAAAADLTARLNDLRARHTAEKERGNALRQLLVHSTLV